MPRRLHHTHTRRGQLDGERQAVEPIADATDRLSLRIIGIEIGPSSRRTLDEQPSRRLRIERRHPPRHLTSDSDRLAARGEDRQARQQNQQPCDELGDRAEQVLTIVEHRQEVPVAKLFHERLGKRPPEVVAMTERSRHGRWHERRIGNRRELNPAHSAFALIRGPDRELQHEARLAATPRTRQRHQPLFVEQRAQSNELRLATNEARQRNRKVARGLIERAQRGEIDSEIGMAHLPDVFRTPEILQVVKAEIPERHVVDRMISQEISGDIGDERLPAVADRPQPGAPNDRRAAIVLLIAQLCLSRVQGNPHPHGLL